MQGGTLHRSSGRPELSPVWRPEHATERMRGLLGRMPLGRGEGMLLAPCASVHTIGMRYPLDLVFLDADQRVIELRRRVPPLRMAFAWGARATLELAAGEIDRLELSSGEQLQWRPSSCTG